MTTVGTRELARLADVHIQRIYQWRREGLPQIGKNKWDAESCLAWIEARRSVPHVRLPLRDAQPARTNGGGQGGLDEEPENMQDARLRYMKAKADRAEMEREMLAATVVLRERVRTALNTRDNLIAAALHAWVLETTDAHERALRQEVADSACTVIADTIEGFNADLEHGENISATRIRYAQRLG